MPHLVVWGIPSGKFIHRGKLHNSLCDAVVGVRTLGLQHEDVSVSMPLDTDEVGQYTKPIIVIVELLFEKPERTPDVRQQLAHAIADAVRRFYPSRGVEVAVKRFNPEHDGFVKVE